MTQNSWSDDQLEYKSEGIRSALNYGPIDSIGGVEFLERYMRSNCPPVELVVVPDDKLPYSEAEAYPAINMIKLRKSTNDALVNGSARAKFIVVEEICHLILKHDGAMHRTVANDNFARASARKRMQEREAKFLAASIIAPQKAAAALDTAEEISSHFGLSMEAARIRFEQTDVARRKRTGKRKQFSKEIVSAIRKLEGITGYRVKTFDGL